LVLRKIATVVGTREGVGIARTRPANAAIVTRVNCMIECFRGRTKSEEYKYVNMFKIEINKLRGFQGLFDIFRSF
jgi:hypothetical protein